MADDEPLTNRRKQIDLRRCRMKGMADVPGLSHVLYRSKALGGAVIGPEMPFWCMTACWSRSCIERNIHSPQMNESLIQSGCYVLIINEVAVDIPDHYVSTAQPKDNF